MNVQGNECLNSSILQRAYGKQIYQENDKNRASGDSPWRLMAFHSPNNLDRLPASHAKIDELYWKFLKNQPSFSFFECQISPDMVRRERGPENQREVILLCKSTRRKEEEKKQKRRREEKKVVFFTSEKITKERCCGTKLKKKRLEKEVYRAETKKWFGKQRPEEPQRGEKKAALLLSFYA